MLDRAYNAVNKPIFRFIQLRRVPMTHQITAMIERERSEYVSICPELDIARQGKTVQEARDNLREALELFLETAPPEEIKARFHNEVYVTQMEVAFG